MTRRKMREQIFKILFQIDFHPKEEWDSRLKCPEYEDGQLSEEDSSYIEHKVFAVAYETDGTRRQHKRSGKRLEDDAYGESGFDAASSCHL